MCVLFVNSLTWVCSKEHMSVLFNTGGFLFVSFLENLLSRCKMKLLFPDVDPHRVEELARKMR